MIAALSWIKIAGISALILAVVILWLRLDTEQANNRMLVNKLSAAADANNANQSIISSLQADNLNINSLLVKRQQQSIKQKEKLNDDIRALKSQFEAIDCYREPWPDPVAKRLRESY